MSKKDNEKNSVEGAENTAGKAPDRIEVGDPVSVRPKDLPLVVRVPDSASSAQKEYAKVLNAYAYHNPEKWAVKKEVLIKRLESLAGKEVVVSENQRLSINKSAVSFVFIKDGKEERYAGPLTQ